MNDSTLPKRPVPMHRDITGLVLAGGRAIRMGGVDKGLQPFAGKPLIAHVLDRLMPQVGRMFINANRSIEDYRSFGHPVIRDADASYSGPLAGMLAGLEACETEWMMAVPCDSPFLPLDLTKRLAAALTSHVDQSSSIAYTHADGQDHPVFMLMRIEVQTPLREFIAAGGRKIDRWAQSMNALVVDCSDVAEQFANINSLDELARAEQTQGSPGDA